MLIDFHTHAFPDRIAAKTIAVLEDNIKGTGLPLACTDGTVRGLQDKMRASGVDVSVVCPIATTEHQTESINRFAKELDFDGIISFGSVYPFQSDRLDILERLAESGFSGIKLHPEYQQFEIDCKESAEIIAKAEKLGLLVVVHAGQDPAYRAPWKCTPEKVKNLLGCVSGKNLILAHMGGMGMWDDVEKYLVGTPVMFDTAAVSSLIKPDEYRMLILEHGADRILFGSDCPWEDPRQSLAALKALKLPKADFEQITYLNACGLLNIKAVEK